MLIHRSRSRLWTIIVTSRDPVYVATRFLLDLFTLLLDPIGNF